MLRSRLIPVLLLRGKSFVKTVNFKKFSYIGDPCNTVRIFNELEVDEISILDILATRNNKEPNYELISEIASEAFMPLSYGGGIKTINQAKRIFDLGIEKIILNLWSKQIKDSVITQIDAKTKLQELSLKKFKKLPIYKLISNTGPRHKPIFKVGVKLLDTKLYISEGGSKKDAEQNAAIQCLKSIKKK